MEAQVNPFETPATDGFKPEPPERRYPLAEAGTRFVGRLVDNLIAYIPSFTVAFAADMNEPAFAIYFYAGFLPIIILQAVLITTRAQSVGKMLLKMKIVDMNHVPVGFVQGVLVRSWLTTLLEFVPIFGLVDALFIFREDRRTLHDLISGTQVVDVSVKWFETD